MEFIINDRTWQIKEVTIEELREQYNKDLAEEDKDNKSFFYGLCCLSQQKILINKDIHINHKKKTLYHELMHCYINVFIAGNVDNYNEELLCDISGNSHDIIHKIVKDYFKED